VVTGSSASIAESGWEEEVSGEGKGSIGIVGGDWTTSAKCPPTGTTSPSSSAEGERDHRDIAEFYP
jgi:hypothetical protein